MGKYKDGQRDMRDRIIVSLKEWAIGHPHNVVSDELWQFINNIRSLPLEDRK